MKKFLLLSVIVFACASGTTTMPDATDVTAGRDAIADTKTAETTTDTVTDQGNQAVCPGDDPSFVQTNGGCIQGYLEKDIRIFKGIPYAEPPVGDLRWRAPQQKKAWKVVLDAKRFSPTCIQFMDGLSVGLNKGTGSEDCLYLNVWTPVTRSDTPLPVMFFIHGGSDAFGSASEPVYDGSRLAKKGVVVVTINYRLGLLGFMGDTAFNAEDTYGVSGNYGMLDILAALKWVNANIANFNGDPKKITIFGESAGAIDTCLLMFSPLAKGLFNNVILESGSCLFTKDTQTTSNAVGKRVEKMLNCDGTPDVAACLRSKSTDELVQAGGSIYKNELLGLYPHVDGYFLTESPVEALANGHVPAVPIIAGTNRDEGTAFTGGMKLDTQTDYEAMMSQYGLFLGLSKDDLIAHYPVAKYKNFRDAFNHFVTDATFVCPTRKLLRAMNSRGATVYQYEFTYEYPGSTLGVTHGAELFYVFGSYIQPAIQDVIDVSDTFIAYWTNFAAASDPNGSGLTKWLKYDKTANPYLIIDKAVSTGQDFRADECDFLDTGRGY